MRHITGLCRPLVVIVRHVPKDKLERLVQASCSVRVVQGQPIHIHDPGQGPLSFMILTAALDFFPRRQELAVFLSSSDLSHLSQEPWGEGPGQDRFLQQYQGWVCRCPSVLKVMSLTELLASPISPCDTWGEPWGGGSRWWRMSAELFVLRSEIIATTNLGYCSAAYLGRGRLPSKC